jgi:WD40 repeat protein
MTAKLSPDERTLWMWDIDGRFVARDLVTGVEARGRFDHGQMDDLAFSPDGRLIATASRLGFAKLWKADSLQSMGILRGHLLGVHSVSFTPDGRRLVTGSNGREAVKLWDVETQQQLLTLEGVGSLFNTTTFSADGDILGARSHGGAHFWRAPSWPEIAAAERILAKAQ